MSGAGDQGRTGVGRSMRGRSKNLSGPLFADVVQSRFSAEKHQGIRLPITQIDVDELFTVI
jgi:hypothetical protein